MVAKKENHEEAEESRAEETDTNVSGETS